MEKELLELYQAVKKAADAASSTDNEHEESRCIDALEQLKKFPVNYQVLVSTQVGRHLKHLIKHPRKRIRTFATDLIELWKDIIIKETSKNKNGNSDNNVGSANGETTKAQKLQKTSSMKVEKVTKAEVVKVEKVSKAETVKLEKIDRNGTSSSDHIKKEQHVDVKIEKTDSVANVKVEKITKDEKQVSGVKKTLTSPAAPPKLKTMIKSNDVMRDKIREILQEAFSKVSGEADDDFMDEVNACDPIRVAVTVESVLFEKWGTSNGAQKVKYRSLMFNLKDPNNPDFRRRVLLGDVEPERLINMTTAEMASEKRKQENKKIEQKALHECERGGQPKATTDQFKCGRCGQRKCTYYQMQTRSADEPMTTYVTCVVCGKRWKFC